VKWDWVIMGIGDIWDWVIMGIGEMGWVIMVIGEVSWLLESSYDILRWIK
jgi:hypothetical protein